MFRPTAETTVRDLLAARPEAIRVLAAFGIDFCCGGGRPLAEACARAGQTFAAFAEALEAETSASEARTAERDWGQTSCAALIEHILETHHRFTYEELERLGTLADKVERRHGESHAHLSTLHELVDALTRELLPHMLREERVLFPYVQALEEAVSRGVPAPAAPGGHVARPITVMENDHETVGELLREVRALTNDYTPPEGACRSYQALYAGLAALESDVHQHVHLENNVLFPKALKLAAEREAAQASS